LRFLVDECVPRQIVERLRLNGHDAVWARDVCPGDEDTKVLARAVAEDRLLLTEDRDFGELTVRFRLPAIGVIIASVGEFALGLDAIARHVVRVIEDLGGSCTGALTVIEPGRARQRPF
jgi:predicted nuclease of predicted toxin-antitoxin system